MGIYTRTGDDGTTGLPGGTRVGKADPVIECLGALDELNAAIGLAAVGAAEPLHRQLCAIQRDLLSVGAHVAAVRAGKGGGAATAFSVEATTRLEREIDAAEAILPPLRNFILPGGCETAARLHLARTICRRTERQIARLAECGAPLDKGIAAYVNRLSDWLFVAARRANHAAGVADIIWQPPRV